MAQVNIEFDVVHSFESTEIEIKNLATSGSPDITLNGAIENPIGSTTILNQRGDIVAAGSQTIVQTNTLDLDAPQGSIGTASNRLKVQLIESAWGSARIDADAGLDIYLDLQLRLRIIASAAFTFNVDPFTAGRDLDLLIRQTVTESTVGSFEYLVEVEETVAAQTTSITTHFRPPPSDPIQLELAIFGSNPIPIDSVYVFTDVIAGQDVTIITDHQSTRIDVFARIDSSTQMPGKVRIEASGNVDVDEVAGDLRVARILSNSGDLTLDVPGSILDVLADATADVVGNTLWLNARSGSIGELGNALEINSSVSQSGRLVTALAPFEIVLTELTDDLRVNQVVVSESGDIRLTVIDSSALRNENLIVGPGKTVSTPNGVLAFEVGDDVTLLGVVTNSGTAPLVIRADMTVVDPESGPAGVNPRFGSTVVLGTPVDPTRATQVDIYSGEDDDVIRAGLVDVIKTIVSTGAGEDQVTTGSGHDLIMLGSGDDVVHTSGPGDDEIFGSDGDDVIFGGDGKNIVQGEEGADRITTGADEDTIFGGPAGDIVDSGGGDDVIVGGHGDDHLTAGPGSDIVWGGAQILSPNDFTPDKLRLPRGMGRHCAGADQCRAWFNLRAAPVVAN